MRHWCFLWMALTTGCGVMGGADGGVDGGQQPDASGICDDDAMAGLARRADGGAVQVRIQRMTPEPAEKGDNTWILRVETPATTTPVGGAQVTLKPFMPQHGHGTNPADFPGTESTTGEYQVGPFNLFMPGRWELNVHVTPDGGAEEIITFHACIEG
ncbi:MAG: FixH family protein [Myxococcota bacterium]